MSNKKIKELEPLSALTAGDTFVVVNNDITKQVDFSALTNSITGITGTDIFVTGGTMSANSLTLTNNENTSFSVNIEPFGNLLYVDYITGDDITGTKGSLFNKYKTISAAESGATTGDTIIVTTMQYNQYDLGKDGIHYHFLPGSGIINDANGSNRMFTDLLVNAPLNIKISGDGDFIGTSDGIAGAAALFYFGRGTTLEFEIRSSTIVNSGSTDGWHFWSESDNQPNGLFAYVKGTVKKDVTGGHYFLGAHSGNANIHVEGSVNISAIFVQAEGTQFIDLTVDNKITVGYSPNQSFKYFALVDRVPFFTGNIDTVNGTNTFRIKAKQVEWDNSGAAQWSGWGIISVIEYNDSTNAHTRNYVNFDIGEFIVNEGDQATKRQVIKSRNMGNNTLSVVKFDNCKMTIGEGFALTDISSSVTKDNLDIVFQDCSIDYQTTGFTSGTTIIDTSYGMFHFENTRFKVADTTYKILDSAIDSEISVYGGGLFTNGVMPGNLVNINTELPLSSSTTNVFSGLSDVRII